MMMALSTVMGGGVCFEDLGHDGEGGVLLDGHGLQRGPGEDSELGTRIRHRVMVARVAWMSPIGHPWQGDLEVGIGRPTYLELDWEGEASP